MTGAPRDDRRAHRYRAPDFDTLVDSPIVIGNPAVYEFTVDGKRHYLVNEGEGGVFDGARAAKDLEAIVREHRRMWGSLPYDKYLFLNLLTEAGGGLEHKNSTVLMAQPLGDAHAPGLRQRGSSWPATSSSTRGTSSASARWSWGRSTTRARSTRRASGSPKASPTTTATWLVHRAGPGHARGVPGCRCRPRSRSCRRRPGGGAVGRAGVLRRVDQVLPAGRELAEHVDQLLHEGRGGRRSCWTRRSARRRTGHAASTT